MSRVIWGGIWGQRSLAASELRISDPWAGFLFVLYPFQSIPTFNASHLGGNFLFNISHAHSTWAFCITVGWK